MSDTLTLTLGILAAALIAYAIRSLHWALRLMRTFGVGIDDIAKRDTDTTLGPYMRQKYRETDLLARYDLARLLTRPDDSDEDRQLVTARNAWLRLIDDGSGVEVRTPATVDEDDVVEFAWSEIPHPLADQIRAILCYTVLDYDDA